MYCIYIVVPKITCHYRHWCNLQNMRKIMKYFKFTMSLDQIDNDVAQNNNTEIILDDLTEKQQKALAEVFASLVEENKAKITKTVEAIR